MSSSSHLILLLFTFSFILNPPSSMENNAVSTGDKSCIATQ